MNLIECVQAVINEAVDPKKGYQTGHSGFKMKHVGSGAGKAIGGLAGNAISGGTLGIPGMVAGHYVGKGQVKDPEKKMDDNKRLHRFSAVYDKQNSMKQVKAGAKGVGAGAVAGGVGSAIHDKLTGAGVDADKAGKAAAIGAGLAGGASYAGSAIKAGHKAAKRLGYGKFGRAGVALGGATAALLKPKRQSEHEAKVLKKHG